MKFVYGRGGALTCDEPLFEITQTLDAEACEYYGGRYFIGESLSKAAALLFAKALSPDGSAEFSERPV